MCVCYSPMCECMLKCVDVNMYVGVLVWVLTCMYAYGIPSLMSNFFLDLLSTVFIATWSPAHSKAYQFSQSKYPICSREPWSFPPQLWDCLLPGQGSQVWALPLCGKWFIRGTITTAPLNLPWLLGSEWLICPLFMWYSITVLATGVPPECSFAICGILGSCWSSC